MVYFLNKPYKIKMKILNFNIPIIWANICIVYIKCKLNILIHHEYKLNILKYDKYT